MNHDAPALTPREARKYYDRFGRLQDTQGFYERPALDELLAHAGFAHARNVFEFGCGTGKFAARLLAGQLPASATYLGCDVSPVMVGLAARHLEAHGGRAQVVHTDGTLRFPLPDHSVDRVIAAYVLDLLSGPDTRMAFSEAHRVLVPDGKLCLVSLTPGTTPASRLVSSLWMAAFRMRASLVGGCRPVCLDPYMDRARWRPEHDKVVTPFGVPSRVLVLAAVAPDAAS